MAASAYVGSKERVAVVTLDAPLRVSARELTVLQHAAMVGKASRSNGGGVDGSLAAQGSTSDLSIFFNDDSDDEYYEGPLIDDCDSDDDIFGRAEYEHDSNDEGYEGNDYPEEEDDEEDEDGLNDSYQSDEDYDSGIRRRTQDLLGNRGRGVWEPHFNHDAGFPQYVSAASQAMRSRSSRAGRNGSESDGSFDDEEDLW